MLTATLWFVLYIAMDSPAEEKTFFVRMHNLKCGNMEFLKTSKNAFYILEAEI